MQGIRRQIDKLGPAIIEKLGILVNPVLLRLQKENNQLLVFYFHGLYEKEGQKDLNHVDPQSNMTISQLEAFVEYFLSKGFKFICPDDLNMGLDDNYPSIMITFDDGYYNNLLAVDVLNKYKIPALFFLTTSNIHSGNSFWWDIIYKIRTKQGSSLESIRSEQSSLKSLKYNDINDYIIKYFGKDSFKPFSDIDRPFTGKEVMDFAKNPFIHIGNHTHNHAILTNYSKDEIKEELSISNNILNDLLGIKPISIAFPNGNFNNMVLDAAKDAGFRYAFTTESRSNILPLRDANLVCISRFMTRTDEIQKYASYCRLGYDPDSLYMSFKTFLTSVFKVK